MDKTITVFIPFFNEDKGIKTVKKLITPVLEKINLRGYKYQLILLDDGSTDRTQLELKKYFETDKNVKILNHRQNLGLAAGMKTAIKNTKSQLFASLDADCTYLPKDLIKMLDIYEKEKPVLITASPYHPMGKVNGLPLYRLIPSFSASFIYRFLTRTNIHTFTSMFRLYQTKDLKKIKIETKGFLVFTEILLKLNRKKAKIVEFPTTLGVRKFNHSKMRLFKTILGHLELMTRYATYKL